MALEEIIGTHAETKREITWKNYVPGYDAYKSIKTGLSSLRDAFKPETNKIDKTLDGLQSLVGGVFEGAVGLAALAAGPAAFALYAGIKAGFTAGNLVLQDLNENFQKYLKESHSEKWWKEPLSFVSDYATGITATVARAGFSSPMFGLYALKAGFDTLAPRYAASGKVTQKRIAQVGSILTGAYATHQATSAGMDTILYNIGENWGIHSAVAGITGFVAGHEALSGSGAPDTPHTVEIDAARYDGPVNDLYDEAGVSRAEIRNGLHWDKNTNTVWTNDAVQHYDAFLNATGQGDLGIYAMIDGQWVYLSDTTGGPVQLPGCPTQLAIADVDYNVEIPVHQYNGSSCDSGCCDSGEIVMITGNVLNPIASWVADQCNCCYNSPCGGESSASGGYIGTVPIDFNNVDAQGNPIGFAHDSSGFSYDAGDIAVGDGSVTVSNIPAQFQELPHAGIFLNGNWYVMENTGGSSIVFDTAAAVPGQEGHIFFGTYNGNGIVAPVKEANFYF